MTFNNNNISKTFPQLYAKLGGLLYIIIIIAGISSEFFFRGKLIVEGNAVMTAKNIESFPQLWRLGIVTEFICIICTIILAMIYFFLLKPVHKYLNLLATFFRIISITVQVIAVINLGEAMFYLDNNASLKVFNSEQLYAMTNLSIKAHSYSYSISLLFLGCCFLIHGYLIYKSNFLPKILGILIQIAGLGYMTNGFTLIIDPALTKVTFPIIFLPVFIAETSLSLWLLIKGIDIEKWKAKTVNLK